MERALPKNTEFCAEIEAYLRNAFGKSFPFTGPNSDDAPRFLLEEASHLPAGVALKTKRDYCIFRENGRLCVVGHAYPALIDAALQLQADGLPQQAELCELHRHTLPRTTLLDLRSYGAKGDGETDDTVPLTFALADAADVHGAVLIPPGRYVTARQQLYRASCLRGEGTWGFRSYGLSELLLRDGDCDCMFDLHHAKNASFYGISLNGRRLGENVHAIKLEKPDFTEGDEEDTPTVDGCKIGEFSGDGIHFRRVWCYQIRHSQMFCNGGAGLWMNACDGFILDNWFSGNGKYGVFAAVGLNNGATNFTANRIEWNGLGGVRLDIGGIWNLTGNNFDRNSGPGLHLGGKYAGHFMVSGNYFHRNGKPEGIDASDQYMSSHIYCENCSNLTFTSNGFMQGVDDGHVGNLSPKYVAVFRDCTQTVFMANSSDVEGVICEGGESVIIKDNVVGVRHYQGPFDI